MFMWKWNIKLRFTSNWRKIVVEYIWYCQCVGDGGTINRKTLRDISRKVFNSYNRLYAFPCIFNAVSVGFKVMIVVASFVLLQNCRYQVSVVFIYSLRYFSFIWGSFAVINFFSKLVLIEMDFWSAGIIQGFVLNFSLHLLTIFNGACVSKMESILFKKISIEILTFYWSIWSKSAQSL